MKIKRVKGGYGKVVSKKGKVLARGSWGQCKLWLDMRVNHRG